MANLKLASVNEVKIEKGVALPAVEARRKPAWPLRLMEVGDSFFIKDTKVKTISRTCGQHGKRLGRKFASRTVDGGVRVWRTE